MVHMTILSIILFFTVLISLHADTINIPADYPTIQEGINAAVNGDTVLVAPGTYVENIDFMGKNITVKSSDGPELTVIDGGRPQIPQYASVVTFRTHESADAVLEGFRLKNGTGSPSESGYCGGAVFCYTSSPTITNNIINWNTITLNGGGIYSWYGSPTITNNVIYQNQASHGGGIFCRTGNPTILNNTIIYNSGNGIYLAEADPVIGNNEISNNKAVVGGGIYCKTGNPTIQNNTITSNTGGGIYLNDVDSAIMNNKLSCNESDRGGGIYCYKAYSTLSNNLITGNSVDRFGGGIYCYESTLFISNSTLSGNSADQQGGGIYCNRDSSATIINSILWNNSAPEGFELWIGNTYNPSTITVSYTIISLESGSVFARPGCVFRRGDGVIDANPFFVNPSQGDFHLTFYSPCRDAGDNSAVTELFDLEGDPRMAWGSTVDMGHDEFYTHLYVDGYKTPGGRVQDKLIGIPGTSPVYLFIGSGILPAPVPTPYGEFHLLTPNIMIPLVSIPLNGVLSIPGKPVTIPPNIPAPYDIPMQGLVGLSSESLTNLCVLEVR